VCGLARWGLCVVLLAACWAALVPAAAGADTLNANVKNAVTGRCLADTNGAEVTRWEVPQFDCVTTDRTQRWHVLWAGTCASTTWCAGQSYWTIQNAATARCLAIESAKDANLQQAIPSVCVQAWLDQKWVQSDGRLINYVTGRCLAVVSGMDRVGLPSVQVDCHPGWDDQKWVLAPPEAPPAAPSPSPSAPAPVDSCAMSPRAPGVRLRVGFRRSRATTTATYGTQPVVHGRLTDAAGAPLARAAICVAVRTTGQRRVAEAPQLVATDARGRFTYRVPPGPSRRLWFVYRTGGASTVGSVAVRVPAPVSFRLSPRVLHNRQAVQMTGRVGGPALGPGLVVELQAYQHGEWQTFATTRTHAQSRFHHRYRFTRTFATHTYRLRARVRAQHGDPFATGASRGIAVRVVA
jgi:hypothetical protein